MGGLLRQITCTLTKAEAADLNVISSVRQTRGEQCTWVRVALKGACFLIKREEDDRQEKNGRNEAGAERSQPSATVWTNHSAALTEQQFHLSSPR